MLPWSGGEFVCPDHVQIAPLSLVLPISLRISPPTARWPA
jgi:hypothetical protein